MFIYSSGFTGCERWKFGKGKEKEKNKSGELVMREIVEESSLYLFCLLILFVYHSCHVRRNNKVTLAAQEGRDQRVKS